MNSLFQYLFAIAFATYVIGCSSVPQPNTIEQSPQGIHPSVEASYIAMDTKPIPEINWQNIRPPYDWWDFFRDAERHPFHFRATGLDMLNAWWLIEASTLVYSDPDLVQKTFARAGLPVVRFFDVKSTQCFVASNDDFITVAFRGTETGMRNKQPNYADIVYDLLIDVRISLVPYEGGGLVHEGFKQAIDEVWWDREPEGKRIIGLKSYLDELSTRKGRPVWFTGHSLGAALATLAAERYGKAQGVYTFGSPRVGNMEFKNHYRAMLFRFVNYDDIGTRVPPEAFSYRHVGNVIFIDVSGRIGNNTLQMDSSKDPVKDSINDVVKSVEETKRQSSGTIPSWLLNHVPVLYSTHIWNNYVWGK